MTRRILMVGLCFLAAVPGAFAAPQPSLFSEANAKYLTGDFQAAAELYQKIAKAGNATSAVYYNLGNAELRLGQKGEALVYYERALKAAPRDKDLKWNIHVLQSALPDRIEDSSPNLLRPLLEKMRAFFTLDEIALSITGALALLAALALLDYLSLRAVSGILRPPALFLLAASVVLFGLQWWDTKDPRAVVLDKETSAFYGPSDRETKAFVLHEGAEGKILDSSNDWFYIVLENKNVGWIRKNSCEIV